MAGTGSLVPVLLAALVQLCHGDFNPPVEGDRLPLHRPVAQVAVAAAKRNGMANTLPDRGVIADMLINYMDGWYRLS